MQVLNQFSLPIIGLKIGQHDFSFNVGDDFFQAFEKSPYKKGKLLAVLELEKKFDHFKLNFEIKGFLELECHRCTDLINFPIIVNNETIVKYDENERENEDIIYINPDASEFNCAKVIYENILLGLPMYKTCDEVEGKTCDPSILEHLQRNPETDETENALSSALKNIKLN